MVSTPVPARRQCHSRAAERPWRRREGPGWGGSGQEDEDVGVAGAHHGEMTAVQGGDLGDPKSFGDSKDAGVDAAQVEIGVGLDQLGHPGPVGGDEILDDELARDQGAVEGWPRRPSRAGGRPARPSRPPPARW